MSAWSMTVDGLVSERRVPGSTAWNACRTAGMRPLYTAVYHCVSPSAENDESTCRQERQRRRSQLFSSATSQLLLKRLLGGVCLWHVWLEVLVSWVRARLSHFAKFAGSAALAAQWTESDAGAINW